MFSDLPSLPRGIPGRYTPTQSPASSVASTPPSLGSLPEIQPTIPEPEVELGPTKTVDMMLVVGGMDTEGEIFDDCLVLLLDDLGENEVSSSEAKASGESEAVTSVLQEEGKSKTAAKSSNSNS